MPWPVTLCCTLTKKRVGGVEDAVGPLRSVALGSLEVVERGDPNAPVGEQVERGHATGDDLRCRVRSV
jgi:hypothetical protein